MQIDHWYVEISAFHLGDLTYGNIPMTGASLDMRIFPHMQIRWYVDISSYLFGNLTYRNIPTNSASLYMQKYLH